MTENTQAAVRGSTHFYFSIFEVLGRKMLMEEVGQVRHLECLIDGELNLELLSCFQPGASGGHEGQRM